MQITGAKILILGGWGLVGSAICRKLMSHNPAKLIVTSLRENEAKEAKEKIVYVDKEIEVIKWRTETRIKTIKEYVKDENLTDCQNALNFARTAF